MGKFFFSFLDFPYVVPFLFLPFSFLTSKSKTTPLWACVDPVSRFSPPVVSIWSYILVFRLGLALYLCESPALHLLPPVSFSTISYFSVTVRNPDGSHLFRAFLSLSQYWT